MSSASTRWDPKQYLRFANERSRPFDELIARIPIELNRPPAEFDSPVRIADLGCGPGNATIGLLQRWPSAAIVGVDSSPQMIADAQQHAREGLQFVEADLRTWRPDHPLNVLVSNATLQWVPDHLALLPALVGLLANGGWIAFQLPGNLSDPHHRAVEELSRSPRWRSQLGDAPNRSLVSHDPIAYADALAEAGCDHIDVWTTEYVHVLQGEHPVLEWLKGTGLRPVLNRLDDADQQAFCDELAPILRERYPAHSWGTPFPFRRIFAVAQLHT
jgi:trans-aconitate 2-methyltransferase